MISVIFSFQRYIILLFLRQKKIELTGKPRRRGFNYNPSQRNTLHFLLKIMIHFSNYESIIQMLDFFNLNILRNEIKSPTILPCPDRRVCKRSILNEYFVTGIISYLLSVLSVFQEQKLKNCGKRS